MAHGVRRENDARSFAARSERCCGSFGDFASPCDTDFSSTRPPSTATTLPFNVTKRRTRGRRRNASTNQLDRARPSACSTGRNSELRPLFCSFEQLPQQGAPHSSRVTDSNLRVRCRQ